ncbi:MULTISPECIES: carboxymuconolactone decarboxylase family protein [unclassified Anoxybacillus]|uniref:carboxymuconolactone decarboxylase family protein n=1 Tax=unclassified Anoxybacillus TaxID=2639704 RepID=UPI00148D025A|nr:MULTISPECIES: carboxymuconolactone decarboxylase family protein [unclassified Anoxybacillus]MBW7651301.1 carboxymuconolactone decarboxylase family protein [Anoxybacillus sp. ST4]
MSMEQCLHEYKQGLGTFTQQMPHVGRAFNAFTEACFAEGELSKKEKQLIALAISVAKQDEYCTIYHTKGCIDEGATEKEIFEACAVASALAGGATMSQSVTLVRQCVDEFTRMH